ncbi:MAG TPA: FAD-dependent oxidoreductase [Gammaproteobacteria bacterium]|nr:FAD-dependent oxidoreductase [Gammaproteobacteria bacterium]
MTDRLVIAGSGFAGTWAAIAAARARALAAREAALAITVVSPAPELHIRPRFYEASLEGMAPDLDALFRELEVTHVAARVESLDAQARALELSDARGARSRLHWDRLVLATGSVLFKPDVPGLAAHAFDVDQLAHAQRLDAHLKSLAARPASAARDTVVVAGGGFTGIEAACELPARLRAVLGERAEVRVVMVEQAPAVGPDLGPGPRPVILEALAACGVEALTGVGVAAIDADGVTLTDGRRIAAATVVWTAGARAHPLAAQLPGEHDRYGRIAVDAHLRAPQAPTVFVTGDLARAAADDAGHEALMSCQHALSLGRVAGYNAAADLLGLPLHAYRQPKYVTCLDLGPWGAVLTEGWDREVQLRGAEAKALKRDINTKWIYPPTDRATAFELGAPGHVIVA